MVKKVTLFILFLTAAGSLNAQHKIKVYTGLQMHYRMFENQTGLNFGSNGAAFEIGIKRQTAMPVFIMAGAEIGAAGVSNYLGLNAGLERPFSLGEGRVEFVPGVSIMQGLALFRPDPMYLWGIEESNVLSYRLKRGSTVGIVFGFRLYAVPGYKDYSSNFRFVDMNIGLRFVFRHR